MATRSIAFARGVLRQPRELADRGRAQHAALLDRVEQRILARRRHRLSEARYESGVDDYLGVLDAQRALYAARQARIGAELEQQLNLVTLYRALGGGLDAGTPAEAPVVGALPREAQ